MRRFLGPVCVVLLAACGTDVPASGPGEFRGELIGPNGAEGAAVVVLVGEGIQGVQGSGDTEVHASIGSEATQLVLLNQVGGSLTFVVSVSDTTAALSAVVQEVAGPDDELRDDPGAYRVGFDR